LGNQLSFGYKPIPHFVTSAASGDQPHTAPSQGLNHGQVTLLLKKLKYQEEDL